MSDETSAFRRYAGLAGAAVGVLAAGAAVGAVAVRRRRTTPRGEGASLLGTLHGEQRTVVADDGIRLYADVDEAARSRRGKPPITVVLAHGYALSQESWHLQREALRDYSRRRAAPGVRLVLYDQRSHGRSERSPAKHASIDQLGRDLAAVLDQLAPEGRVVLVGHSMGGMSIMALAEQHPELFGQRIAGVVLVSTSAGGLTAETLGLPGAPGRLLHRLAPSAVATLARTPRLVESGRRASSGIAYVLTRKLAFGGPVPRSTSTSPTGCSPRRRSRSSPTSSPASRCTTRRPP